MQITQEARDRLNEILDRGLCSGLGQVGGPVCVEQAISLALGEPATDKPTCVHPVVRAHAVRLNDAHWSSERVRADSLRAYALNQLGTTEIDGVAFARTLALRTIQEILPIALRAAKLEAEALACEQATDLKSTETAARNGQKAAAAAYAAAYAAADAADAADAAYAAADARDRVLIMAAKIADECLTACKAGPQ